MSFVKIHFNQLDKLVSPLNPSSLIDLSELPHGLAALIPRTLFQQLHSLLAVHSH